MCEQVASGRRQIQLELVPHRCREYYWFGHPACSANLPMAFLLLKRQCCAEMYCFSTKTNRPLPGAAGSLVTASYLSQLHTAREECALNSSTAGESIKAQPGRLSAANEQTQNGRSMP